MAYQDTVWDWFKTALVHDLAKTRLDKEGVWRDHNDLARPLPASLYPTLNKLPIDLKAALGERAVSRVLEQHEILKKGTQESQQQSLLATAVTVADHVQKAMHGMTDPDGNSLESKQAGRKYPALETLKNNYSFYPFYGTPSTQDRKGRGKVGYTEETAAAIFVAASNLLGQGTSLKKLMDLQKLLFHFPHTTYIPHLSLGLHQQLSADLFYFAYLALRNLPTHNPADLKELKFYLIELRPDPLSLFYRMRDARIYDSAVQEYSTAIFDLLFREFQPDLPEITPRLNPFVFFNKTGIVFLYHDADRVTVALDTLSQSAVAENFRALTARVDEYRVNLWDNGRLFANPNIGFKQENWTRLPPSAQGFHMVSPERCRRCGLPIPARTPDLICDACHELMTRGTSTVWLDDVSQKQRLGYLFLRIREPLRENARAAATELIAQFESDRNFNPHGLLHPTKSGLLETLQAVLEISELQNDLLELGGMTRIVEFPELMIWVMREGIYHERVEQVTAKLDSLKMKYHLAGMLVSRNTPFWSLMDDLATGKLERGERGVFFDFQGGDIVMFTKDEIQAIRHLASMLNPNASIKNQLNILVTTAGNESLEGVLLQLDIRMNQNKINSRFGNELRVALSQMTGDTLEARTKRALFIKNIIRLIGFVAQGQNQDRGARPDNRIPQRGAR